MGQLASISVHNLYDVSYDMKTNNMDEWKRIMPPLTVPEDGRLSAVIVPTIDTTRYSWLLRAFLGTKKPVMFCGESGCAKTATV